MRIMVGLNSKLVFKKIGSNVVYITTDQQHDHMLSLMTSFFYCIERALHLIVGTRDYNHYLLYNLITP